MYHAYYLRKLISEGKFEILSDLDNLSLAIMNTIQKEDGMLNTSTETRKHSNILVFGMASYPGLQ